MMVAVETFGLLERCGIPQRTGLTVPRLAPFGLYRTKDGYISICAPTEIFILLQFLGPLFNQHRYAEAFWMIALCPVVGVLAWLFLGRDRSTTEERYDRPVGT
jgi:hypothetical protein